MFDMVLYNVCSMDGSMPEVGLVTVTQSDIQDVIGQARGRRLGLSVQEVSKEELDLFNDFINRMLAIHLNERRWLDFHLEHMGDYLLGFVVAKEQFDGMNFGGATPSGSEFGVDQWRAGYVNVGHDWNDEGTTTASTAKNWIHAGGGLASGSAGNDVRFLEAFVGVMAGFGDYRYQMHGIHSEIESFQIRLNNRTLKPVYVGNNFKLGDFALVGLDEPIIVKDRTQLRVQYITNNASVNVPYVAGIAFGQEGSLNKLDADDLDGSTNKLYEGA